MMSRNKSIPIQKLYPATLSEAGPLTKCFDDIISELGLRKTNPQITISRHVGTVIHILGAQVVVNVDSLVERDVTKVLG